jgi:hypothetical protein
MSRVFGVEGNGGERNEDGKMETRRDGDDIRRVGKFIEEEENVRSD